MPAGFCCQELPLRTCQWASGTLVGLECEVFVRISVWAQLEVPPQSILRFGNPFGCWLLHQQTFYREMMLKIKILNSADCLQCLLKHSSFFPPLDTVFFHLPPRSGDQTTVYGVSCYRQIEAKVTLLAGSCGNAVPNLVHQQSNCMVGSQYRLAMYTAGSCRTGKLFLSLMPAGSFWSV